LVHALLACSFVALGCSKPAALPVLSPQPLASPALEQAKPTAESKKVLLVVNMASPDSITIGNYYQAKRGIPKENVAHVNVSTTDNVSLDEYKNGIAEVVRKAIKACPTPIDYIVLTKGVPIRLNNEFGQSVDACLGALNLKVESIDGGKVIRGEPFGLEKSLNPYYGKNEPFSSTKFGGMYLVTRLDGYTVDDAKRLVDNSLAAKPVKGLFFMDAADNAKAGGFAALQKTFYTARDWLKDHGFDSRIDETREFVAPDEKLMGYISWGSNDKAFNPAAYKRIKFLPGSIAETYVSTSARTFAPVTSGQSVITDLIANGVTGVKGYVSEPFTFALCRADILFGNYVSGRNLAESFYSASMVAKWKDVVIGDPLCCPYAKKGIETSTSGKTNN